MLLGPLPSGPAPFFAHGRLRGLGCAWPSASSRLRGPALPGQSPAYRDHPDYGGEVDHAALLAELSDYDGWALPTSAEALPVVLALCPPGVRIAAWHRGERPTRSRWPLHAWEPIIYYGGRQLIGGARRVDSIVCGVGPLDTLPGRVLGAEPAAVRRWIFTLLGACPGDTLDDLFPGSGAVGRAWAAFTSSPDPSPKPRVDASLTAAGDASDPGALVLVPSSPDPSSPPTSDGSSKARPYASSGPQLYASPKASRDASSRPRATVLTRHLSPHPTAISSLWKLPRDCPHRAGDGPRPPGQAPA